ncbi:MAG: cell division protein FtsZ [Candidatus Blackburnbacteria bacterium RIFCSPHIGHO2_02_FULL_39_13]|uniref:Cell division protein FtsZ n=1 Tax=Candidatus Blackburnbacteria bacterium RIFCSPLOWO2_01_FULL_40_20 TaxID=1797519 RepID=A0A1G1VE63_9BACT|nr:MAG: Cell division protein FtsZ [Microgenomates group bacterium GW2011_GWA2_39_19]OGY06914.1 MAG: cell division protein FtsZ [Candidatus Blackburnbacteria bacterium RIFCSPHIGHO2_01_FULL_40_17]OGY09196.1 MAG: cell division protein FtsZ [Candidatus Blackburnbacteria bacterium RIFCSPHIGHO2_02_FULL_39_13]OGY13566.1 MAG: cell division protein FtsZ [Candidatus Blackburnbacteria bacterium RIFCSPLOWO2_01_FULL_40_20]HBL52218.1 cell division protein FtsZ [Candidatus Blackburnbacteria bacterium]
MALVKPDTSRLAKIKVISIGGGGGNAINHMIHEIKIDAVEFIAMNTDAQVLLNNSADTKLQIGEKITRGLGVGGDPEVGQKAAEESREKIKELLIDSDMVFLTAGMGGGTGTGATPVVAQIARESGALTVAIVTKPFAFEGARRAVSAEDGIEKLADCVDALIVIPNQRLMDVIDRKVSLLDAFKVVDSVLTQGVQGIAEIITIPGLINVDFADVRTIMRDAGSALLGIGTGIGENRAQMAARAAISSPLLDLSIEGAKGVLFNIAGGLDMTMNEVDEAARIISETVDADANIIFGATINEKLSDQLRITVVATGFDQMRSKLGRMVNVSRPKPVEQTAGLVGEVNKNVIDKKEEPTQTIEEVNKKPNGKDEWGEEFEIPAFLRQGR